MSRITELLDLKGIEYKDTGGDILICCLNPDHDDKHPSLRIDPETGIMNSNKWSGRAMAKSVISISLSLSMMIDREPLTNVCGGSQPLPWENTIRP